MKCCWWRLKATVYTSQLPLRSMLNSVKPLCLHAPFTAIWMCWMLLHCCCCFFTGDTFGSFFSFSGLYKVCLYSINTLALRLVSKLMNQCNTDFFRYDFLERYAKKIYFLLPEYIPTQSTLGDYTSTSWFSSVTVSDCDCLCLIISELQPSRALVST